MAAVQGPQIPGVGARTDFREADFRLVFGARQVGRREFEVTHRTEVALDCMTVVVDMVLQSPRLSKLWQP